jgi:hypothetical protein
LITFDEISARASLSDHTQITDHSAALDFCVYAEDEVRGLEGAWAVNAHRPSSRVDTHTHTAHMAQRGSAAAAGVTVGEREKAAHPTRFRW